MEKFFEEYLALLDSCHNGILGALQGLPVEALDWSPGPEMNSLSVLVFHTTGSERYWIGDVAMDEFSNRDRAAEFAVREVTQDVLMTASGRLVMAVSRRCNFAGRTAADVSAAGPTAHSRP